MDRKGGHTNIMSAISEGASNGVQLAVGIGGSLIAIRGLVALVNGALGIFGVSLQQKIKKHTLGMLFYYSPTATLVLIISCKYSISTSSIRISFSPQQSTLS